MILSFLKGAGLKILAGLAALFALLAFLGKVKKAGKDEAAAEALEGQNASIRVRSKSDADANDASLERMRNEIRRRG